MDIKNKLLELKHKTRIRSRYRDAKNHLKVASSVYKTDGTKASLKYIKAIISSSINKTTHISATGDVLLISIEDPLLDRYRTNHMMAALESTNVNVGKVFYSELTLDHVKRYNTFIFYRCPWLPAHKKIIQAIKERNKVAIYAVDDLVIDTKYTNQLPVVKRLAKKDRIIYDNGVDRHNKLMKHCDYAITTTKTLKAELQKYKNFKEVYIDRNTMSEEMISWSDKAIKTVKRKPKKIVIGYFSGTDTHNEDFAMVAPALIRILKDYDNTYIKLAGRIDAPKQLEKFKDRIIFTPYVDWRMLPFELRACDIILAPLVDTLFNRAKSEIKWSESALVAVPTVCSDIGAFTEMIKHKETGILVKNTDDDWYHGIKTLIENEQLRQEIGDASREYVQHNCNTVGDRAVQLADFIHKVTPPVVAFAGISLANISGGNLVIKKHMDILRQAGNIVYGVEYMAYTDKDEYKALNNRDDKKYDIFRVASRREQDRVNLVMHFDRYVATFWDTVRAVDDYKYISRTGKKLYLVQNFESGFYNGSDPRRNSVLSTYRNYRLEPITISKWCKDWLKADFNREAKYAPNGIDLTKFTPVKRKLDKSKIKILIEGDSASEYKRTDESFKIANKLDHKKFEISYLSYNAKPKKWYKVDNVYIKVPYEKVAKVYQEHDILLKSSVLESFSYPPLEMMATGGVAVLVKNGGNAEYIQDGKNAIYYKENDIDDAVAKINQLVQDQEKYKKIATKGIESAQARSWDGEIREDITRLYE